MQALDLFCGAGGASVGLKKAGFKEVTGVDINSQKEYPFISVLGDALVDIPKQLLSEFDFIWASPPCQAYSWGTVKWRKKGKKYPDLIGKTRELLLKTGKPFVIENVIGAPLRKDLMLCGEMFELRVIRHRIFEIHGFPCEQPQHKKHKGAVWNGTAIGVWNGGKPGCFGNEERRKQYDKKNSTLKAWQEAMGIDWVTNKKSLAQCVPPAYAEYVGKQFLNQKQTRLV